MYNGKITLSSYRSVIFGKFPELVVYRLYFWAKHVEI